MARRPVALADTTKVQCRVLKMGDGKIQTGAHATADLLRDDDSGDLSYPTYAFGDVFEVERPIGEALEDRGFVEIQSK
jgi:hypothetical protein